MTLGSRIQKYRNLHNMSQKELGIKLGFSPSTAIVRVSQYESDKKCPKWEIRERIAEALDIDVSALYTETIQTIVDVVRTFFFMEEKYGFKIENYDLSNIVFFNIDKFIFNETEIHILNSYMYIWQQQKKNLLNATAGNTEDSDKEYELWKSRFPRDIQNYWKSILDRIDTHYNPLVKSLYNSLKINTTDEFITQIRKLIQAGFEIESNQEFRTIEGNYLTLTFMVSDMLSPKNKTIEILIAEFLNNLNTLEGYGMKIERNIITSSLGNKIVYNLRNSRFSDMNHLITDIIQFEKDKSSMDEYSKELFELRLKKSLQFHYVDNLAEHIAFNNNFCKPFPVDKK